MQISTEQPKSEGAVFRDTEADVPVNSPPVTTEYDLDDDISNPVAKTDEIPKSEQSVETDKLIPERKQSIPDQKGKQDQLIDEMPEPIIEIIPPSLVEDIGVVVNTLGVVLDGGDEKTKLDNARQTKEALEQTLRQIDQDLTAPTLTKPGPGLKRQVARDEKKKAYRGHVYPIVHDHSAQFGSALQAIEDLIVPKRGSAVLLEGVIMPAVIGQTELQLALALKSNVPGNVSGDYVKKVSDRIKGTSYMEARLLRAQEGRGLKDFVKEDASLFVQGVCQTLETVMVGIPQVRFIEALREAAELIKNQKTYKGGASLVPNLLITAATGIINTLVGMVEAGLKPIAAIDTRFFYFATGLLKGKSTVTAGEHELFDRVNWTVKNVCCNSKAFAIVLGLSLMAGYFVTCFLPKQALQADINFPKNLAKCVTKFASAALSFRSVGHSEKDFIEGSQAFVEMLPALLIPDNMFNNPTPKFAEQAAKLGKEPLAALSPTNWSRLYHFRLSDSPVFESKHLYHGFQNFVAHGWTAWAAQIIAGLSSRLFEVGEGAFNKHQIDKWKAGKDQRIAQELAAILKPHTDLTERRAIVVQGIEACETIIKELSGDHTIEMPDSKEIDVSKLEPSVVPQQLPVQESKNQSDDVSFHVVNIQDPDSELLKIDAEIPEAKIVGEEDGFWDLMTPEQLVSFIEKFEDLTTQENMWGIAVREFPEHNSFSPITDCETPRQRIAVMRKIYEETYNKYAALHGLVEVVDRKPENDDKERKSISTNKLPEKTGGEIELHEYTPVTQPRQFAPPPRISFQYSSGGSNVPQPGPLTPILDSVPDVLIVNEEEVDGTKSLSIVN